MADEGVTQKKHSEIDLHEDEFVDKATKYISSANTEELMVLRAQLLSEYYINSILAYSLPRKEANYYSGDRAKFHEKLIKFKELKIIEDYEIESISRLNRVRNKFGHQIDYQVAENDVDYLGFSLGSEYFDEKYALSGGRRKSLKDRLNFVLVTICVVPAVAFSGLLQKEKKKP